MPRLALPLRASAALLASVLLVAGCGGDEPSDDPTTPATSATSDDPETASPTPEEVPTASPQTTEPTQPDPEPTASDTAKSSDGPVGRWRNKDMQWVLRIKANGKFFDDYSGVKNIRSGTWRLKKNGTVVVLKGGDGVTTRGKLTASTITIKGTVLTRVE